MDPSDEVRVTNSIYLNGFICKNPVYRITPFGREISDILLAVNRAYNKSDYIPCIAWGVMLAMQFEVGDNIKIWGRIQSRKYQKKLSDGIVEDRIAYEVSISKWKLTSIITTKVIKSERCQHPLNSFAVIINYCDNNTIICL